MLTSYYAELNLEDELLSKWAREKAEGIIPVDKVEELLRGKVHPLLLMENHPLQIAHCPTETDQHYPHRSPIRPFACPHNASLWRLQIHEGCTINSSTQTVAVLEAMKLEIKVSAGEVLVGGVVEKVLVSEGEVVKAGENLMLIRNGKRKGKK